MSDYWVKYRYKHPLAPKMQHSPKTSFFSSKDELDGFLERNFDQIEVIVSGDQYAPNRKGGATE